MAVKAVVVSDTSVLLNLCWLKLKRVLPELGLTLKAPPIVRQEFERIVASDHRFTGLNFPAFVEILPHGNVPAFLHRNTELDPGEIGAMALALELSVPEILMDEKAGRSAARALGLRTTGVLGILLRAKKKGLIEKLEPLLDRLTNGAQFWIGETLRVQILRLAKE